jgi:leucyl aminopeptidase
VGCGALPERLPAGKLPLATPLAPAAATQFRARLAARQLSPEPLPRQRPAKPPIANALIAPQRRRYRYAQAARRRSALARDLINAPANQLGPEELAAAAVDARARYGGRAVVHSGEALRVDYPLIAAVGAGSSARAAADRLPLAPARRAARDAGGQGRVL